MLMTKKVSTIERDYPSIKKQIKELLDYLLVPGYLTFPRAPFGIIFVDDQKSLSKICAISTPCPDFLGI